MIDRLLRAAEDAGAAEPADWTDFFVGVAGAAAALAGLVVVAISINVDKILAIPRLVHRARMNVAIFVNILVIATVGLVPVFTEETVGALATVTSGLLLVAAIVLHVKDGIDRDRRFNSIAQYGLWYVTMLLPVIGGIVLIAGSQAGLVWIAAGIAVGFVVGMLNAWVLLVEILR